MVLTYIAVTSPKGANTKAFKYRIYPNAEQKVLLGRTFGSCRFVWNYLLGNNKEQYTLFKENKAEKPDVSFPHLNGQLTKLKGIPEYTWLYEVSAVALQQKVKDLAEAFQSGFKTVGKGLPNFKSKHKNRDGFRIVGECRLKDGKLFMPKDKTGLRIKWSRGLPCEPSSYTISKTPDGKYWVSFLCKDYEPKITSGKGYLGIDLGLKDLVVDSNGVKYSNPKWYRETQVKLAKAQRVLSRRKKGSARRNRARLKVAKLHAKVSNQRKDYLHKLSRTLINENQVIGMEDLKIKGMVRNRHLSKSILDAGWGMFKTFLMYKATESQHVKLVLLDPFEPSTQTCNTCLSKRDTKLTLNVREWVCPTCDTVNDRDENAACNMRTVAVYWAKESELFGKGCGVVKAPKLLASLRKFKLPVAPVYAQSISKH